MPINFSIIFDNRYSTHVNITLGSTNVISDEKIIKVSSEIQFPSIVKITAQGNNAPIVVKTCFLGHIEIQQHIIDQIIIPRHLNNGTTIEIDFHTADYLQYLLTFGNKILV